MTHLTVLFIDDNGILSKGKLISFCEVQHEPIHTDKKLKPVRITVAFILVKYKSRTMAVVQKNAKEIQVI